MAEKNDDPLKDVREEPDLDWLMELTFRWNREAHPEREYLDLDTLPHYFQELRDTFDSFNSGNWLSLLDAIQICRDEELPLPRWVSDGVQTFFIEALTGKSQGGKGRGNNPIARTKDSLKRQKRYDTVRLIRNAQDMEQNGLAELAVLALPCHVVDLFNSGSISSVGTTIQDAVDIAELSLRGDFAQASNATILKNFHTYWDDWFIVSHETQVALGLATAEPEFPDISRWLGKTLSGEAQD